MRHRSWLRAAANWLRKAFPPTLSGVDGRGGWWIISRPETDFQQDIEIRHDHVLTHSILFACITLIASDIGKLRLRLVELDGGVWQETTSPAFSPVLRKPNRYQTRQKFIEQWIVSKLAYGNTYVLKERDDRGVVIAMYVLDPQRVVPLVAPDGSVYYRLGRDDLSQVPEELPAVPASEIVHDTMVCLYHPLVGVSPIFACGLAAVQGLKIQQNSAKFFENMSRPSGILTAPGEISDETAERLKLHWETNYTGGKIGKVAVLGDSLKYEAMTTSAVDSQLVDQLKLSAEMVCSAFHVPPFKVGAGAIPAGQKVEDLNQIYYTDCLQSLIESAEALLDEGLGLSKPIDGRRTLGTEFDLDDLLRMDTATKVKTVADAIKAGCFSPDEGRRKFNLPPVPGGDTPYLQQQNFSLAALAKRDAQDDPFKTGTPAPAPAAPALPAPDDDEQAAADTRELLAHIAKGLQCVLT